MVARRGEEEEAERERKFFWEVLPAGSGAMHVGPEDARRCNLNLSRAFSCSSASSGSSSTKSSESSECEFDWCSVGFGQSRRG